MARSKTIATLIYLGFALQLLQVGIIPLLPLIGKDLGIEPGTTSWLVTSSLLAGAVFLAVFSRLADLIGKTPVVRLSLALVLVGSLIGCFATSFAGLLVARILMGAVLPMLALPEAIAADTMPKDKANVVIGAIHSGTGIGIAGGLVLGGLAGAGDASWRWFFIVGAISSAIGIGASWLWLRDGVARATGRLDLVGAALLAAGLSALLLGLTQGPNWGWGSVSVWGLGIVGVALLALWWAQQARSSDPLIHVDRLVLPEVRLPFAMTFLVAFGIYSSLTAISRYAQSDPAELGYGYGWSPLQVAWYAVPQVIGCIACFVLIRRMVRRGKAVEALTAGACLLIVTFLLYGLLTAHPFFTLLGLALDACGLGTVLAVTQIVALRAVAPSDSGIVLGLTIVLYALGNAVGSAVTGVFFESFGSTPEAPSLTSFRVGFAVAGFAAVLALGMCLALGDRVRRPRPDRRACGDRVARGPVGYLANCVWRCRNGPAIPG